MQRYWWVAFLILLGCPGSFLWGAETSATVTKITGKAQVQKEGDWVPLTVGQKLVAGDNVSTGFRSELQLQIGPSTLTLKALSRLTIQKLNQEGTSLQTDVYLKVGKVDAEVNKSEAVQKQSFTVTSPVATASVRGTAFSFDGITLEVARGLVDFSDFRGNTVSIPVGEAARANISGSGQGIATNQSLVVEESVVDSDADSAATEEDGATLEWNGWSYEDLLSLLYGYSWSWVGGYTSLYVGGIEPLPLPAFSHISVGGITSYDIPTLTHLTIGGIGTAELPALSHISIGGISPIGGSQP